MKILPHGNSVLTFGKFSYRPPRRSAQSGYFLLVILLMVFFLSMALLVTMHQTLMQQRRDREEEMIHRGAQYARAIKKYLRKFGRYPTRLEDLENTNNIRFLRKRYKDPMSAKGDWRLLHFGEVQLNRPGQGGGGSGTPGASGTSGTSGMPSGMTAPAPSTTAQSASPFSGTFGGGPIIGVASTSEKQSVREFDGKSHYNQWLFVYDPTTDRGGLITGPYQPLKNMIPGAQGVMGMPTPGATPIPGMGGAPGVPLPPNPK